MRQIEESVVEGLVVVNVLSPRCRCVGGGVDVGVGVEIT